MRKTASGTVTRWETLRFTEFEREEREAGCFASRRLALGGVGRLNAMDLPHLPRPYALDTLTLVGEGLKEARYSLDKALFKRQFGSMMTISTSDDFVHRTFGALYWVPTPAGILVILYAGFCFEGY